MAYLSRLFHHTHARHYRSCCATESPDAAVAAVDEEVTIAGAGAAAAKGNFPVEDVVAAFSMGTRSRWSCQGKKREI